MLKNLVNTEVSLKHIQMPNSMVCTVTANIYAYLPPTTFFPDGVAMGNAIISSEGLL
jgi:hypothetical protein